MLLSLVLFFYSNLNSIKILKKPCLPFFTCFSLFKHFVLRARRKYNIIIAHLGLLYLNLGIWWLYGVRNKFMFSWNKLNSVCGLDLQLIRTESKADKVILQISGFLMRNIFNSLLYKIEIQSLDSLLFTHKSSISSYIRTDVKLHDVKLNNIYWLKNCSRNYFIICQLIFTHTHTQLVKHTHVHSRFYIIWIQVTCRNVLTQIWKLLYYFDFHFRYWKSQNAYYSQVKLRKAKRERIGYMLVVQLKSCFNLFFWF